MIVIYSPADGAPQRYEFNPSRVRQSEAEVIEGRAGVSWEQWLNAIKLGSAKARRVLLWACMRQQHPMLRIEDAPDPYVGEVVVEFTVAELTELRESVASARVADEEQRAQLLAGIDAEIEVQAEREAAAADLGKAPLPSAG